MILNRLLISQTVASLEVSGKYSKPKKTKSSASLPFLEGNNSTSVTEFTSIILPSDSSIDTLTKAAEKD